MEKLAVITSVFSIMNECGVSIEDLVAFSKNQNQELSSVKKLPLEILYEHDYRSFFFEADKKPVAIICDNIGFAFEDAPEEMDWYKAEEYCKKYSIGGKKWKLPNKEAGHLDTLYKNKEAINVILKAFGKEALKKSWYWASEYSGNTAWGLYLSDGTVGDGSKYHNFYVRPVLAL